MTTKDTSHPSALAEGPGENFHQQQPACVGLLGDTLNEIHDMLVLALDATERQTHFSPSQIEARAYMNVALRRTRRLIGGAA